MIRVMMFNGQELLQPETEQEWLDMQPEAKLRELFRGDTDGMLRFHDRLRELDARFCTWLAGEPNRSFWRKHRWLIYVLAWLSVPLPREARS